MKPATGILSLSVAACVLFSLPSQAASRTAPINPQHVFVPKGFDSNDHSEIFISAYLPNLCYKSAQGQASQQEQAIQIAFSAVFTGDFFTLCPQVIVPVFEKVSIGVLDEGDYALQVNGKAQETMLHVGKPASTNIDDHIYANVLSIEIVDSTHIVLHGKNPSKCLVLDRISYISNGSDTYSVLPIMKRLSDDCPRSSEAFAYPSEVPTELTAKEILLHVRALNGQSVNAVIERDEAR